jgi:hypothetical protein
MSRRRWRTGSQMPEIIIFTLSGALVYFIIQNYRKRKTIRLLRKEIKEILTLAQELKEKNSQMMASWRRRV